MANGRDFENLVAEYYEPLYQFALSLTREEPGACDLVQQTFCVWAAKGHQLRDASKVKTWLFTTLHREFLGARRRLTRFPHLELDLAEAELPVVEPAAFSGTSPWCWPPWPPSRRPIRRPWRCSICRIIPTKKSAKFSTCPRERSNPGSPAGWNGCTACSKAGNPGPKNRPGQRRIICESRRG